MVLLIMVLVPSYMFMGSVASGLSDLGNRLKSNELLLPSPNPDIEDWPLIGDTVYASWKLVKEDANEALLEHAEELKLVGQFIIKSALDIGKGILMFCLEIM